MKTQRGFGLVEAMVAAAVGMLLTLLASAMLLAANVDYLANGASTRLDDSGRFALAMVSQALRQSGFRQDMESEPPLAVTGLDSASLSRARDAIERPLASTVNGSDVLAVRYAGSGAAPDGDGSVLNCAGFGVPELPDTPGWSIFYVAVGNDGEAELRCKYRGESGGWGADAIVRGVDSFQVLYGLDTDSPADGVPNQFLNARAIGALDAALPPLGATAAERARSLERRSHWRRVVAVRVALLLHGEAGSRQGSLPTSYELFGDSVPGDSGTRIDEATLPRALQLRVRRVFSTTVALRNTQVPP